MMLYPKSFRATCATFLLAVPFFLIGCGSKEKDKPTASTPAPAKRTESEPEPVLSAGDAAVLKGGPDKKPAGDADRAWEELITAIQSIAYPPEWQLKEPSKEEVAALDKTNSVLAGVTADKAKDFYTRFPNHEKASDARQAEMALLGRAVQLGNTNRLEQLRQLEETRLKDPNLSEDDRLELRIQQIQRAAGVEEETNTVATLTALEKGARTLQKEFPKRSEVGGLLLSVAQGWLENSQTDKSRQIAQELAEKSSDEEVKSGAQELLKKIGRIGKPLDLKFKAIDGHEVDLQKLNGKVVLVDFWATWCAPCMAELPKVKAAYEKLHGKGFEILGVSFDREKGYLDKVVAREQIAWPQYFDDSEGSKKIGEEFGITGIPTMWLVDKKGLLRDLNAQEGLAGKVEKLLAEP